MDAQLALGSRLAETHELPAGEEAKTLAALDRLWQELRLDRRGTIVALGGGCTTDAAGFAAATYCAAIAWVPVPTSLVAQVDAAIGGKTAIDLPQGKNLVGAFHWPVRTVVDPALLETLPERRSGSRGWRRSSRRACSRASRSGSFPTTSSSAAAPRSRRRSACAIPHDRGERKMLNLGHTFAHALEAAAGYEGVTHGRAVALGLLAALRLSGQRHRGGRGGAAAAAGARRPRARVGGDAARQEGARRRARLVLLGADGPSRTSSCRRRRAPRTR